MNLLTIIGNCTKDPELRTTPTGKNVCTFTVAVNRRKKVEGQPEADFFRVSAWDQLGENCQKYLTKGKKVCVVGSVGVHVYTNSKGEAAANLEVLAREVEFLSPRQEETPAQPVQKDQQTQMEVVDTAELPF
ncbi:MAG: single-stranded DNA-binding protein [Clostridia bacterium]|nr:single-stranded DNA-binding protein [Clostridia bacterium]